MRPVTRACDANSGGNCASSLKRSTLLEAFFSKLLVLSKATTLPFFSMAMRLHKASASSK